MSLTLLKQRVRSGMFAAGWIEHENPDLMWVHKHNNVLIDNLYPHLSELDIVDCFYDPRPGLPENPQEGDRCIAEYTANGWTKGTIYEYSDAGWSEEIYRLGRIVFVVDRDEWYGAAVAGWRVLSNSAGSNPVKIGEYFQLREVLTPESPSGTPELWIEKTSNGGMTWVRKNRWW